METNESLLKALLVLFAVDYFLFLSILAICFLFLFRYLGLRGRWAFIPGYNAIKLIEAVNKPQWWAYALIARAIMAVTLPTHLKPHALPHNIKVFVNHVGRYAIIPIALLTLIALCKKLGRSPWWSAVLYLLPLYAFPLFTLFVCLKKRKP